MGLFGGISALQGGLKGFMSYIKQDKARKSARLAAERKRNSLGYNTAEKQVGKGAQTGAELKAQREASANGEVSTGLGGLGSALTGGRPDSQAPPIPPVGQGNNNDIMKDNKFANQKMQSVGANLWQGQEMVAQKDAMKSVRSNPVPVPGGSDDSSGSYGDMFMNGSALMNVDRKAITAANRQRRQDRRQRKKDIKKAGGPENYSQDGYHVGEFDKKGRNIQYPEKRYSKKNPPQSPFSLDDPNSKYKKVNVQDLEDKGSIKSDEKGKYIVNSDEMKTNSSRDTLRLGKNPKHFSGKEYKDKDLIDETDYENFAKDVNKK